jgi:hypothetical protein
MLVVFDMYLRDYDDFLADRIFDAKQYLIWQKVLAGLFQLNWRYRDRKPQLLSADKCVRFDRDVGKFNWDILKWFLVLLFSDMHFPEPVSGTRNEGFGITHSATRGNTLFIAAKFLLEVELDFIFIFVGGIWVHGYKV